MVYHIQPIRPYTDDEWDKLPHAILTSDAELDSSVIDSVISDNNKWHSLLPKGEGNYVDNYISIYREYMHGETGWRNNECYVWVEAMMYNIMDLNAQDEFTHINSIFSKDLMLHDDEDDEECCVIKYCDNCLVKFDNIKSIIIIRGKRKLSSKKYAVLKPCFLFKPKEICQTNIGSNNSMWEEYFIQTHYTPQIQEPISG